VRAERGFERRLLAVSVVSGGLFLLVLGLFALLIFRSLSSRLTDSVLAESRADAESIAKRLAGGGAAPLRVSETTQATALYLHSVLQEKRTVEYITVTDRDGRRLFEGRAEGRRTFFDEPPTPALDLPDGTGRRSTQTSSDYDIAVPIENIGFLHVGVSKDAVAARLEALRADLVRKTGFAALAALMALAATDVFVWRLVERNRRLEDARLEDRRLTELGAVAAGLAHEIRNPLHAIGLSLQNLEEKFPEEERRFAGARSEVKRLDRLVSDFLLYARPLPLKTEEAELRSFLLEACAFAALEAREKCVVIETGEVADVAVRWDAAKMRQVLWNLLRNGIEACASVPPERRRVSVEAALADRDDIVLVRVRDTGEGIPEDFRREIPALFKTTKKGGSGLGLMVALRIVKEHGGTLAIASRLGEGTSVELRIPRRVDPEA
jgi:signal transduction histidine kinase